MFLGLDKKELRSSLIKTEILTNDQMRSSDRLAIVSGTPGYDLMLAAGQSVANIVHEHYSRHAVLVLCGPGNNGGDGFVAAMFLKNAGRDVTIMSLIPKRKFKGDAKRACKDWGGKILNFKSLPDMPDETVVIDAVFGTGLSKPLESPVTDILQAVKEKEWPVVAVDIPSGVNGDTADVDASTLEADYSVTFFRKKRGHVLMPGLSFCGEVTVHDIGIPESAVEKTGFSMKENQKSLWQKSLPSRKKKEHKYNHGHLVILGGARMTGAARLASEAAMRIGSGLCTIVADEAAALVYKEAAAHVLYEPLNGFKDFARHLEDERRNAVLMGPGAGLDDVDGLRAAVLAVLATKRAVVLDADALTCFADDPEVLYKALHDKCVLTPHGGEFEKLFPALKGSKIEKAESAAALTGAVILLKGPDTVIAQTGSRTVVNTHATPFLATAGAGDVLAGIIAGLLAQGVGSFDAACAGAWIHGDAAARKGAGLVAPDIIEEIPAVLRDFT